MPAVVPVVHRNAAVRRAIRRSLPRRGWRVEGCRSLERLGLLLQRRLVDAVVVEPRNGGGGVGPRLRTLLERYPRIPFFVMGALRPDDADLVRQFRRAGMAAVLMEGVDDGAAGELIVRRAASARRRAELADVPRVLRLTEPLQLRAWEEVLSRAGSRTTTAEVARAVRRTREHLSREFGAGGAPNLKRVIDLVRVAWAADLLANPGYGVPDVAVILRFASPSHVVDCVRRVAGVTPGELPSIGPRGVLARFVRGRMRSRI